MKRIKEERKRLGYKQEHLAKKLGIATNTLCNWEIGRREPSIDSLKALADIFDCSIDYLLERTDIRKSSVIERSVQGRNLILEVDKDYYKTLSVSDVEKIIKRLEEVGFNIDKLKK